MRALKNLRWLAVCSLGAAACATASPDELASARADNSHGIPVGVLAADSSEARSPVTPDGPAVPSVVAASAVVARVEGRARFVVAYRDGTTVLDNTNATMPDLAMTYAWSDDGVRWSHGTVQQNPLAPVGVSAVHGAPALATSADAPDVYYAAVASRAGDDPVAHRVIAVSHSPDGGRTFLAPTLAAGSQLATPFNTADAPSLAVDSGGRVHLAFVADQGTALASVQHWVGDPGGADCSYTCITWQPAEVLQVAAEDAPYVRHPVIRALRRALYMAFEVRTPLAETQGTHDASLRVVVLRRNPFTSAWEHTDGQPADGAPVLIRRRALPSSSGESADAGAAMDFALDPDTGVGLVAWRGAAAGSAPENWDAVSVREFRFVDVLSEAWERPVVVSHADATGMSFQPTVSLDGEVRAVTWLQQDARTGRVRLMGSRSNDDGVVYTEPRNLLAIGGADDASMPVCATGSHDWSMYGSSVTFDVGRDVRMTLTLHVDALGTGCTALRGLSDRVFVAATRWGAGW